MRLTLALALLCLAPALGAQDEHPDSVGFSRTVEAQATSGAALQAHCVIRWRVRASSFEILDTVPAPDSARVMARCGGYPVLLVRPVCLVTVEEGQYYPASTPMLVLRCQRHVEAHRFRAIPFPSKQMERA